MENVCQHVISCKEEAFLKCELILQSSLAQEGRGSKLQSFCVKQTRVHLTKLALETSPYISGNTASGFPAPRQLGMVTPATE